MSAKGPNGDEATWEEKELNGCCKDESDPIKMCALNNEDELGAMGNRKHNLKKVERQVVFLPFDVANNCLHGSDDTPMEDDRKKGFREASGESNRPVVKPRACSTIRRIQEKLQGDLDLTKPTIPLSFLPSSLNSIRRQRSRSRASRYGKSAAVVVQRPYRRWLGVSTNIFSDSRYIVSSRKRSKSRVVPALKHNLNGGRRRQMVKGKAHEKVDSETNLDSEEQDHVVEENAFDGEEKEKQMIAMEEDGATCPTHDSACSTRRSKVTPSISPCDTDNGAQENKRLAEVHSQDLDLSCAFSQELVHLSPGTSPYVIVTLHHGNSEHARVIISETSEEEYFTALRNEVEAPIEHNIMLSNFVDNTLEAHHHRQYNDSCKTDPEDVKEPVISQDHLQSPILNVEPSFSSRENNCHLDESTETHANCDVRFENEIVQSDHACLGELRHYPHNLDNDPCKAEVDEETSLGDGLLSIEQEGGEKGILWNFRASEILREFQPIDHQDTRPTHVVVQGDSAHIIPSNSVLVKCQDTPYTHSNAHSPGGNKHVPGENVHNHQKIVLNAGEVNVNPEIETPSPNDDASNAMGNSLRPEKFYPTSDETCLGLEADIICPEQKLLFKDIPDAYEKAQILLENVTDHLEYGITLSNDDKSSQQTIPRRDDLSMIQLHGKDKENGEPQNDFKAPGVSSTGQSNSDENFQEKPNAYKLEGVLSEYDSSEEEVFEEFLQKMGVVSKANMPLSGETRHKGPSETAFNTEPACSTSDEQKMRKDYSKKTDAAFIATIEKTLNLWTAEGDSFYNQSTGLGSVQTIDLDTLENDVVDNEPVQADSVPTSEEKQARNKKKDRSKRRRQRKARQKSKSDKEGDSQNGAPKPSDAHQSGSSRKKVNLASIFPPDNSFRQDGGLAGPLVSVPRYEFTTKHQPDQQNQQEEKSNEKPGNAVPFDGIHGINPLREELMRYQELGLHPNRPKPVQLTALQRLVKKSWRKDSTSPEYYHVQAIKSFDGKLPGQLGFEKGQIIKQMDTGLLPKNGMSYGYYKCGRLRRKRVGLYPCTHVTCQVKEEVPTTSTCNSKS